MTSKSGMHVDTELVREMAALLKETDLSEIEVVDGDRRVRVARQMTAYAAAPAAAPAAPVAVVTEAVAPSSPADPAKHPGAVLSPMVGTCYTCPEPGKPSFVSVGDTVKEGATVLIIEAMKVMNPISAHRSGTVSAVLVRNEQPVEYGQPLLIIE
jgi:acetyl-CoA carboxylase biotin carboxyl carrier protein